MHIEKVFPILRTVCIVERQLFTPIIHPILIILIVIMPWDNPKSSHIIVIEWLFPSVHLVSIGHQNLKQLYFTQILLGYGYSKVFVP